MFVWRVSRADEREESGALADTSSGRRVLMARLKLRAGGARSEAVRHRSFTCVAPEQRCAEWWRLQLACMTGIVLYKPAILRSLTCACCIGSKVRLFGTSPSPQMHLPHASASRSPCLLPGRLPVGGSSFLCRPTGVRRFRTRKRPSADL